MQNVMVSVFSYLSHSPLHPPAAFSSTTNNGDFRSTQHHGCPVRRSNLFIRTEQYI